jgi:hypothetical protein
MKFNVLSLETVQRTCKELDGSKRLLRSTRVRGVILGVKVKVKVKKFLYGPG